MRRMKILFDYALALFLLLVFLLPMLLIWVLASVETKQNGLFFQQRIGRNGKPFTIYKFRTLKGNYSSSITTEKTHKITTFGRFLVRTKLDETPQLFNILNGTMSFVGPRPDVPGYADKLEGEDRVILEVKPGITGPAQLVYRNESELLNQVENPIEYNDKVIWPNKIRINKMYVEEWSFGKDLLYIAKTLGL